jgi:hypothetical protein
MQLRMKIKSEVSGRLCAMRHSAESTHIHEYLGEIATKFEHIRMIASAQREKTEVLKSRETVPGKVS